MSFLNFWLRFEYCLLAEYQKPIITHLRCPFKSNSSLACAHNNNPL